MEKEVFKNVLNNKKQVSKEKKATILSQNRDVFQVSISYF